MLLVDAYRMPWLTQESRGRLKLRKTSSLGSWRMVIMNALLLASSNVTTSCGLMSFWSWPGDTTLWTLLCLTWYRSWENTPQRLDNYTIIQFVWIYISKAACSYNHLFCVSIYLRGRIVIQPFSLSEYISQRIGRLYNHLIYVRIQGLLWKKYQTLFYCHGNKWSTGSVFQREGVGDLHVHHAGFSFAAKWWNNWVSGLALKFT